MKNKPWYNIVFMLIITALLTGILSTIYEYSKPKIETNEELALKKAHLYAFNIELPQGASTEDVEGLYHDHIEVKAMDDEYLYIAKGVNGEPMAYGFTFGGGALWGEVEGILALSPDLDRVIGIDFTKQSETPGLGGRIGEPGYKEQFRDVELNVEGPPLVYGSSSKTGQVDAITGATLTSNAVLNIMNTKIEGIKKTMGGDKE